MDFRTTKSLGLKLVSTLVRQLKGKLQLSNDGNGAEFKISFPANA
jgi:two-component sensor histidine kinase